jgi:ABC-type lipoprotein export system ATPase subunit
MVFIIGPSGVGKSTILETLGLMNDTVLASKGQDSVLQFQFENESPISFYEIWRKKEVEISQFRQAYFSFIFQSTNLFESISAFDNVLLPTLFKTGVYNDAHKRTVSIIKKIFPQKNSTNDDYVVSDIDWTKNPKITEVSGGQRQRLAFCRAVAHDFKVLFADEPTGNLDVSNSFNLMETLRIIITEKNATAIIVSHDINLALKFASKIILISKDYKIEVNKREKKIGCISERGIFIKNNDQWSNMNEEIIDTETLKNMLVSKFN